MDNKKEYVEPKMKTVTMNLQQTLICCSTGDHCDEVGFAPHEQDPMA